MTAAASARAATAGRATSEHDPGVAADMAAVDPPGRPRTHALVFLHGQPGSGADWQQVTGLLPAHWHTIAADRPGYGSNQRPTGGFAANARDVFAQHQ
jgi:pimeloyl-ACP methyl ester carboxylesterase